MRDIFKPAFSLLLICVVVTFFVALAYNVTKNTITDREWEELNLAMNEVLPGGAPFKNVTEDLIKAVSVDESLVKINGVFESNSGYVFKVTVSGYGGDVAVIVGVNDNYEINGIRLGSNSETPSLGKNAEEEFFTSRFNKVSTKDNIHDAVDSISGVTITSNAVKNAVQQACKIYNDYKGGAGE